MVVQQLYIICFSFLMKYAACQSGVPNSSGNDMCPQGTTCTPQHRCQPSAFKSIQSRPQICGHNNDGKTLFCCPPNVAKKSEGLKKAKFTPKRQKTPRSGRPLKTQPNAEDCGKSEIRTPRQGFVVGGEDAEPGAWPWMVAITMRNEYGEQSPWCTGFLVDRIHAMTAAHCFDKREKESYVVRVGHIDLHQGLEFSIRHIAVHPGYVPGSFYDDIAILTLSKPVEDPKFHPICLPWSRDFINIIGMGTTVAGWGSTIPGGALSTTLKQLSGIPVISNQKCDQAFSRTVGFICAGFIKEEGKDSCGGDSGGPLMFQNNDQWYAVGIVAFGHSCGKKGYPGGYTKVSEYLDWINKQLNAG